MRRGQPDPPAFRRSAALADVVASPKQNGCMETHCVAEHVRLELRNVDAMYPFITSHRFLGIQPNSGHRDYSRLSCDIAKTQLRPNASLRKGYLRRPPLWPPLIGVVDRPPACCKSHRPVPWLAQAFQLFYMLCDYGLRHLEPA